MSTITLCFSNRTKYLQKLKELMINLLVQKTNDEKPERSKYVLRINLNQPRWTIGHETLAACQAFFSHSKETINDKKNCLAVEKCEKLPLPEVGERVLYLWITWGKNKRTLVSPFLFASVEIVESSRIEEAKNQVKVKDTWFEGGGIACKTYDPDLFLGYIARIECVEGLLKMLRWLTPEQRDLIYDMAYPYQKFPE